MVNLRQAGHARGDSLNDMTVKEKAWIKYSLD